MPSLRSFVTRIPQPLLKEFLARHDIQLDLPDPMPGPNQILALVEKRLADLGTEKRDILDGQIERISSMSNEAGEVAIEAVTLNDLEALPTSHARALWAFLNDPQGFQRAEDVRSTDEQRNSRKWTAQYLPEGLELSDDPDALEDFRNTLKEHFGTQNIHIDIFQRSRQGFEEEHQLTQLTIYREGRANDEHAFIEGILGTQIRRPVLEAAVTFEASTGRIECFAPSRDNREDVMQLVATGLLGCRADFQPAEAPVYNLAALAKRQDFAFDAADRIEGVEVRMLRLMPFETPSERITVETLRGNDNDIWKTVEMRLGPDALESQYVITQAKLVIRHRPRDSNRVRSLPITITHPNKSNLKDMTEIERVVAARYLPIWGLSAA